MASCRCGIMGCNGQKCNSTTYENLELKRQVEELKKRIQTLEDVINDQSRTS